MNSDGWVEFDMDLNPLFSRAFEMDPDSTTSAIRGFQFQTNSTSAVINELRFAAARQVRVSMVILASFNVAVAFATAAGIMWDSYKVARRDNPRFNMRKSFFSLVNCTETFPFILSIGIVAQGITFAVAQSKGLSALSILGCEGISELMLPATMITPYIQAVLAIEATARALMKRPFQPRARWVIWFCAAVVGTGLLITYIVARLYRPPNFCFVSLFWLVTRWKFGIFVIMTIVTSILVLSCFVIFFRLHKHPDVAPVERLAAIRLIYYMTSSIAANAFIIPFFYTMTFADLNTAGAGPLQLSMAATVVANLTGLVTGGLYLFLRSTRASDLNSKEEDPWGEEKSPKWGYGGMDQDNSFLPRPALQKVVSNDSNEGFRAQITQPVSPPPSFQPLAMNSVAANEAQMTGGLPNNDAYRGESVYEPQYGVATRTPSNDRFSPRQTLRTYSRKLSYSIFPNSEETTQNKSMLLLPAATYNPGTFDPSEPQTMDLLQPPPVLEGDHRRKLSTNSTATVQIGLRLSNVDSMSPVATDYAQDAQVHDLSCPKFLSQRSKGSSPLAATVMNSRGSEFISPGPPPHKGLPPLPLPMLASTTYQAASRDDSDDGEIRLSPTVYSPDAPSPKKKLPTPVDIILSSNPVPKPLFSAKKTDWI